MDADQNLLNGGRTFVWHEVYGASSQASIDFYTEALDFGTTEMKMEEMGGFTYKMLTRNGLPVAGVLGTSEMEQMQDVPPHWATYISVDNVDARLEKCTSLGATVMVPPMDVPSVGRMALIKDPQGAVVWIFTPAM